MSDKSDGSLRWHYCGIDFEATWEVTEDNEYAVGVYYDNAELAGSLSLVNDDELEGGTIIDWVLETVSDQTPEAGNE